MKKNPLVMFSSSTAIAVSACLMAPVAAEAQEAANNDILDVIYVTARKRQETQIEVPLSVKAFSQNDLDNRGILAAAELSDFVPGFKFEPVGTGGQSGRASPAVRFRGVGVQIGLSGASSAGALLWDGAYVADGIGVVPLIDLAQTEIIKGPQTAFFGRNTFAGAVNFIPSDPTEELEVRLRTGVSATDVQTGYNVNAIVSGPLTDRLGGRIVLSSEKRAGIEEFGDGSVMGEENTQAVLGSLRFDYSDNTVFKFSGYFVDSDDTSGLSSFDAPVAPGDCNRVYSGNLRDVVTGEARGSFSTDLSMNSGNLFCGNIPDWDSSAIQQRNPLIGGVPPASANEAGYDYNQSVPAEFGGGFIDAPDGVGNTYETWRAHLSGESELDNGLTLAGFVSFGANKNWGIFDNLYGTSTATLDIDYRGFVRESDDQAAEFRVTSTGDGRLRYMAGVSYYQQDSINFNRERGAPGSVQVLESEVFGIFGSFDYDITEELILSAEGRYQSDRLDLNFAGFSGSADTAGFDPQSQKYEEFMPRVILSYQPTDMDLNVYGSFSQSYLQGTTTGAVNFALRVPESGLTPETVGFFTPTQQLNAFELGVKQKLNDQFQYSVALYNMDWENQAFFVLSPTFVSVALPGDSEYTGVEFELRYRPTDWLTLQGGYNYVKGEFTDYVATGSVGSAVLAPDTINSTTAIDASGNQIRYIPAHEANLSADFALDSLLGMESFFRADVLYTGAFFIDNFEYNEVDAAVRVNLRAGANITENLLLEVYGNNIFDDRSYQTNGGTTFTSFFAQNDRRTFGAPPRGDEWGIRLTARF